MHPLIKLDSHPGSLHRPHALIRTRKDSGLEKTQEKSTSDQSSDIVDKALANCCNTFRFWSDFDEGFLEGPYMLKCKHHSPHRIIMTLSHVLGAIRLMTMLLGTSNRIYGMKKTKRAML